MSKSVEIQDLTQVDLSDSTQAVNLAQPPSYLEEAPGEEADDPVGPGAALAAVPHEHAPLFRSPPAVLQLHRARCMP